MMAPMPLINSHNGWSPLQEVWLGDVYPASWYDHLAPDVRDVFYKLTEITKQDLDSIQRVLQNFGVTVHRPHYDHIENYIDPHNNLRKPQICPRDNFVVIGNRLMYHRGYQRPWQHVIDQYKQSPGCSVSAATSLCIGGANVVRVGRDIIIDRAGVYDWQYDDQWPEFRVKMIDNGGHLDGCFAILRPGLILANHYFNDYDTHFPGWEVILLDDPTYLAYPLTGYQQPYPIRNEKFWNTSVGSNLSFNQHIIDHALDWVGCYTETYFELNCLSLDENNVIMLAKNDTLAEQLEQHGITVHWVPFRARSFWDGAMHCLTVDIRRQSCIEDFFPERDQT